MHNFVPYTKTNQFDFVFIYSKLLVIFVQFSDLLIYSLDISLTQVYLILNLYKQGGIEGLTLKQPPGRQRKLTDEQERELIGIITEKLPKEVGLEPHCNWTAPLACQYVKDHYGVTFSERGMRDVFYRLHLSYTRPTYVLAKADHQKQAEFVEKLEDIKKTPEW